MRIWQEHGPIDGDPSRLRIITYTFVDWACGRCRRRWEEREDKPPTCCPYCQAPAEAT